MAESNDPDLDKVTAQLHKEIDAVPVANRPLLLRLVQSYREGISSEELPSAEESFREGWQDVLAGKTHPIEDLWSRVNDGK